MEPSVSEDYRQRRFITGRQALLALAVVGLVFLALWAWRGLRNPNMQMAAPPPVAVTAMQVLPQNVPVALEAIGSLRAVREVMLAPEVSGRVTSIGFNAGTHAKAGALLVQLFDAPERADRAAAVAQASFAKAQLARSRELAPSGAESRQILQQRQAEYDQAKAAVAQLDARIRQKQIVAPFAGELGIRQVNLGEYLNPGAGVATLTDLSQLYVDFAIPQQELSRLKAGGSVVLSSDAWPGRSFNARVTAIEPRIGSESRNIAVQGVLPNPDRALRPGMYVTAALNLPDEQDVLVVPTTAIQTSASGDSITVIRGKTARKQGKAEIVAVTVGRRFDNSVIVTSGLKAGDVVVTEGQLRVQPGAEVKVARLLPTGER